eukprot:623432-Rhodomonas_salina.2
MASPLSRCPRSEPEQLLAGCTLWLGPRCSSSPAACALVCCVLRSRACSERRTAGGARGRREEAGVVEGL